MAEWICPECGRLFGRSGQSHDCAPGLGLEEYFATGPEHERPIFDAVMAHVPGFSPTTFDPEILQIVLLDAATFAVAVVPFGAVLPAVTSAEASDNDLFFATVGVPIFTCVMFAVAVVAVVTPDTVVLVRFVIAPEAVTFFRSIDGCE